jgi:hypothetical protein
VGKYNLPFFMEYREITTRIKAVSRAPRMIMTVISPIRYIRLFQVRKSKSIAVKVCY